MMLAGNASRTKSAGGEVAVVQSVAVQVLNPADAGRFLCASLRFRSDPVRNSL